MLEIDPLLLAYHLGLYLAFMIVFTKFAINPFLVFLKKREHSLVSLKERSQVLEKRVADLDHQLQSKLDQAQKEAGAEMEALRTKLEEEERAMTSKARENAAALIEKTEREVAASMASARAELSGEIGKFSQLIVGKLSAIALALYFAVPQDLFASEKGAPHEPSPSDLIFPFINFTVLVVVFYKLLKKPVRKALHDRKAEFQKSFDEETFEVESLEKRVHELEDRLRNIGAMTQKMKQDRINLALAEYEKAKHHIAKMAENIMADARSVCESTISQGKQQLMRDIVDGAIAQATTALRNKPHDDVAFVTASHQFTETWERHA